MTGRSGDNRRGVVLLAVLVIVTLGALAGTTMLIAVQGQRGRHATLLDRDQGRALAWSGVQAVMAELAEQRVELLAGGDPDLTDAFVLFTLENGVRGVVRLVPVDADGSLAAAEPTRLDINHATANMLAALPGVSDLLAERIAAGRPYTSVGELLRIDGVTPDLLYGAAEELAGLEGGGQVAEEAADLFEGESGGQRLADLLTVFSFDPNLIAGFGELEEFAGERRVNLNTPWNAALERGLTRVFGAQAAQVVRNLSQTGITFTEDRQIAAQLAQFNAEPRVWAFALDALSTSDDAYRLGRVDVLRASPVVLAAIPGIGQEKAQDIAAVRDGLSEEDRKTVAWLFSEEVLTAFQFAAAVDHLTTRSLQWRVRIEAGLADSGEDGGDLSTVVLDDVVVYDAVIDVASQRPRVAMLRDVTMLELARRLSESADRDALEESLGEAFDLALAADREAEVGAPGDRASDEGGSGGRSLRLSRAPDSFGGRDEGEDAGGGGDTSGGEPAGEEEQRFVDRRIGRWTSRSATQP